MKKIEFHIHTKYSKDSLLNFFFLLIQCKLKKIDCIAITDHNEIQGALKFKKKFKKFNILVIVGEEIFTKDGEIIGLYLNKKIEPNLSAKETIQKIKEQGGFVYIPHPYEPYRTKTVLKEEEISNNRDLIDLIEVHNGRNRSLDISQKQLRIAEKYNLRKVIGSDAHSFFELGRNTMVIDDPEKENILKSIENSKIYSFKKAILWAHFWTKIVKVIKVVLRGEWNELFRLINKRSKKQNL